MPVVVGFDECLARPSEGDRSFPLVRHLEAVARACGSPTGAPQDKLAFLAGLLHDAGKCQATWQAYVRGQRRKGPPHAPLGAVLFWYFARKLIRSWSRDRQERRALDDVAVDWTRVIYAHHGDLDDLDDRPPWEKFFGLNELQAQMAECDLAGLVGFVKRWFPEVPPEADDLPEWLERCGDQWERHALLVRPQLIGDAADLSTGAEEEGAFSLPRKAGQLVAADRYDAAGFQESALGEDLAGQALKSVARYCDRRAREALAAGADERLVESRRRLQAEAVERFRSVEDARFFTLTLPTGFGKTLTALRVALEACAAGRCRRIVYVAPYISILSQAAREMSQASELEAAVHHHLSPLEMEDEDDVDVLDTWQAPLLATTFNQFFRAVFPARAQECLRRAALREAFVIVDEPQIIDTAVWNLFLRALSVNAREWNCKVLFATATLPPLEKGSVEEAVPLAPAVEPAGRFTIDSTQEPWGPDATADRAVELLDRFGSVAVVLNTVHDAADVYERVRDRVDEASTFCLTGQMLPYHKARTIAAIREELRAGRPVVVVCTQILEAGVDLSFRAVLRDLPILPSVLQVAGRANRHAEGDRARVTVFPYVREDGTSPRRYVYLDETARTKTDALLERHAEFGEEKALDLLAEYYAKCFQENPHTAFLQKLHEAALGRWSELAGIEPFGGGAPAVDVFVPWPQAAAEEAVARAMRSFSISGPEEILQRYLDPGFKRDLPHLERRRLAGLLHRFTVPLAPGPAQKVAEPVNDWLYKIQDLELYSDETGLAHIRAAGEEQATLIL